MRKNITFIEVIIIIFIIIIIVKICNRPKVPSEYYLYAFERRWVLDVDTRRSYAYLKLTAGAKGNLYVLVFEDQCIQKFDSSGKFITKWGSKDEEKLHNIQDLAAGSNDNIYVADHRGNCIQKFDSSGRFIKEWSLSGDGDFSPTGIAVDSENNVYVPIQKREVWKFTSEGKLLKKWPVPEGEGYSSHDCLYDIKVDPLGSICLVHKWSSLFIRKFDASGKLIAQWDRIVPGGNVEGAFCYIINLAIDSKGNIYVSDLLKSCIFIYDPSCRLLTRWRTIDTEGKPFHPGDIIIDSQDNCYVNDFYRNTIYKYVPEKILSKSL